jgi:probable F420-dependent oxidoreductase
VADFGYLLPTRDHAVRGDHEVAPLVRQARLAETLGFDSVWAGDSPVAGPRADPLMLLAAAAATTDRVTLGTAVLLPALRHPVMLAHQLATVDRIAEGRLVAGMGAGFPRPNTEAQFAAVQVGFSDRISRMTEAVDAMRLLWTSTGVSFQGRHFTFDDVTLVPRPVRPAGPPIWLAGSGEAALRRVSQLADGWLPYPPKWQTYAQELATIQGQVTPALYATVCLDEDPSLARKRMRAYIEPYYGAPLEAVESIQAMFAGSARETAEWLGEYVKAGARHIVVRLAAEDHVAALEQFADTVLPTLRNEKRKA